MAILLAQGCSSTPVNTVRTTSQLHARATDVNLAREERQAAMNELLERRDSPVASELVRRAEALLHDARVGQEPKLAGKQREVGLEVVEALVTLGDRSASVITMRLSDPASEMVLSKEALDRCAKHTDTTVRELATGKLQRR